jgi:Ribosomal family S4e
VSKRKIPYLVTHDGRTIRYPDPLVKVITKHIACTHTHAVRYCTAYSEELCAVLCAIVVAETSISSSTFAYCTALLHSIMR